MSLSLQEKLAFGSICREWLDKFSSRFPKEEFRRSALESLNILLCYRDDFSGEPAGWVGGLVYIMAKHDLYDMHPRFINGELEEIFGVSISTIRKRAEQIWSWAGEDDFDIVPYNPQYAGFAKA